MNVLNKRRGVIPNAGVVLVFGFLTLMSLPSARAQINPVYQRMVKNGWKFPFENGYRRLTRKEVISEFTESKGYSDSTLEALKRTGVDIGKMWEPGETYNRKLWTALSDCIVIGTVSKITHPLWPRPYYYTVAYVRVDKFLRNDYNLPQGEITILQYTGAGAYQTGEDTLRMGEHALFFLSASQLILFTVNNNMQRLYSYLIHHSTVYFGMVAKYDIRSGNVMSRSKIESLPKVIDSVHSVLNAIRNSVPINR